VTAFLSMYQVVLFFALALIIGWLRWYTGESGLCSTRDLTVTSQRIG